jgi:hypothetical protein
LLEKVSPGEEFFTAKIEKNSQGILLKRYK